MLRKSKYFVWLSFIAIFLILGSNVVLGAEKGGELYVSYSAQPYSLDVAQTPETSFVHTLIYETLVYYGEDNKYHGQLAKSWKFENGGKEVTFVLREGITFHDGTPMNAEAVVFNFERLMNPDLASPAAGQIDTFEKIEANGEYEVTLYFETPISSLLYNLSQQFFAIQSPAAIKKYGEDYGQKAAVGTGHFMYESWNPGDKIVLTRFEDYNWAPSHYENQGPAYLEKVILHNMPEQMTKMLALEQGDIHLTEIGTDHVERMKNNEKVRIKTQPVGRINYLGLNCSKEPWDNPLVRRAIAHSIDREEIVEQALNGYAIANPTPLSPTVLGHSKNLYDLAPSENIEAGKALLRKAGFKENSEGWVNSEGEKLELEIMTYSEPPYPKLAQIVREQIIKLGIDVNISTLESGTLLSKTPAGEHDAILIAYGWSDPDILIYFFHSKNLDRTNRVHYSNFVIDMLLDEAQTIMEQDDRIEIYNNIQKILITDAPWVNLYTPYNVIGYRENLKGFKLGPRGDNLIHDCYID